MILFVCRESKNNDLFSICAPKMTDGLKGLDQCEGELSFLGELYLYADDARGHFGQCYYQLMTDRNVLPILNVKVP